MATTLKRVRQRLGRWTRRKNFYIHLLMGMITFTLGFFYLLVLGISSYLTPGGLFRTASLILTIEGVLLALSPTIKSRGWRKLAVATAVVSVLYSLTTVILFDFYQETRLFPTFLSPQPMFFLDVFLFAITVDFYSVSAVVAD